MGLILVAGCREEGAVPAVADTDRSAVLVVSYILIYFVFLVCVQTNILGARI